MINLSVWKKGDFMTKWDKLTVFLITLFSVYFLLCFKVDYAEDDFYAEIRIDGVVQKTIPLNDENLWDVYTFESTYGVNVIEIKDGWIKVIEASCPDKLDVRRGGISKKGEVIICLPNRFVVEIVGEKPSVIDAKSK